jgi:F-type H+-transporting ATPase subunit delta
MTAAVGAIADLGDTVGIDAAEEIFHVARVVAGNRQLRGVLADASVPTDSKEALVATLFAGTIGEAARRVLSAAFGQSWSHDEDLVSGIEELGIRLAAQAGDADRVQRELFAFGRAVASDSGLELALDSKVGLDEEKVRLVEALLAGKTEPATGAILRQVVCSSRRGSARGAIARAGRIVAEQRGQVVATVTVAAELSQKRRGEVADRLTRQYGSDVTVNYMVDPAIVGGMRIRIGDEVIDGTITSRLADVRLKLTR